MSKLEESCSQPRSGSRKGRLRDGSAPVAEDAYASMLEAYRHVFAEILAQLHPATCPSTKTRLEIEWGWNEEADHFDATASQDAQGVAKVEINEACLKHLQIFAAMIFSSNDLYGEIGSPGEEAAPFADLLKQEDPATPVPQNELRKDAAFIVTEIGLALVALHEIGHHALGHFQFLREAKRPLQLNEAPQPWGDFEHELARHFQLLELEADRFAFTRLLELAARHQPAFATQKLSDALRPHLLSLTVLAYSLIIMSLHAYDLPISSYARSRHPHAAVRLMASLRHLAPISVEHGVAEAFQKSMRTSFEILAYAPEMHRTGFYLTKHKQSLARIVDHLERLGESEIHQRTQRYTFESGCWG